MMYWLNDTIKEEDFIKMKSYGVQLVRVPTGYWNWINVDGGPEAPADVKKRLMNLQKIDAAKYRPYLDKIITYAKNQDL